jgi:HipA-like protein
MWYQRTKSWIRGFTKMGSRQFNTRTFTPRAARASFGLRLGTSLIGVLSVENGRWNFRYSDEFRRLPDARPLPVFPDLEQTYESEELFPFFKMRVPSLKRQAIRTIMAEAGLDEFDEIALLRRFGRRTISNPFELIEDRAEPAKPSIAERPRTGGYNSRPSVSRTHFAAPPLPTSTYQIVTRAGRPVTAGLFKSADEIFDHIRVLPVGNYHVFRVLPSDKHGSRVSEFWGEVTNHGGGQTSYAPVSSVE